MSSLFYHKKWAAELCSQLLDLILMGTEGNWLSHMA